MLEHWYISKSNGTPSYSLMKVKLQKIMLMNLQTLELFSQALKEDICFYVCDHYLLSYLGKFPLFKSVFDLFFAVRRQRHAAFISNQQERGIDITWIILFFFIKQVSSSSYAMSGLFVIFQIEKISSQIFVLIFLFLEQSSFSPKIKRNQFLFTCMHILPIHNHSYTFTFAFLN